MPQTCFVIMGFGKKTDYGEKVRTLDLDATYAAIIKPAVEACGLACIRADEVTHSGVIDVKMYELLLRADLVIADISTANANAIYELGVRHALRPYRTIIMKEEEGKFQFDLNHLATLQYRHLGEDIGFTEARNKRQQLETLIRSVMQNEDTDSPVFTHLAALGLKPMSAADLNRAAQAAEAASDTLASILDAGRAAARASQHAEAARQFQRAVEMQMKGAEGRPAGTPDPFVVQQLALATYKTAQPDPVTALKAGWSWLERLSPDDSTDPETLGIAGAIQKRLFQQTDQREHLDRAIDLYGRGFEVKRDYYNGENYALCLDLRAGRLDATSPDEALYDRLTARKTRAKIHDLLLGTFADRSTHERPDYKWMLATMANVLSALGRNDEAATYEARFRNLDPAPADWEIKTFEDGQKYARQIAETTHT
jgi:tetratricopeptide (TPR) repeat protein